MTRTYSHSDPDAVRGFSIEAARLIADLKCSEVVVLDVHGQSQVCDFIVIGSGTSQRQMRSVADDVAELGKSMGMRAYRTNRDDGTTWIVVDFVEVVVHLFEPEQRLYYDLELMWSQAKRVDWARKADAQSAAKAGAKAPVEAASKSTAKPAAKKVSKATTKKVASKATTRQTTSKKVGKTTTKKTASRSTKRAAGAGDED